MQFIWNVEIIIKLYAICLKFGTRLVFGGNEAGHFKFGIHWSWQVYQRTITSNEHTGRRAVPRQQRKYARFLWDMHGNDREDQLLPYDSVGSILLDVHLTLRLYTLHRQHFNAAWLCWLYPLWSHCKCYKFFLTTCL